jgi:hypothetical protein
MKNSKHIKRECSTHTLAHTMVKTSDGEIIKSPARFRSNVEAAAESAFQAVREAHRAR